MFYAKYLFVIVLFTALLISFAGETRAQCPDGYSLANVQVQVGDCLYDVKLCFRCQVQYGPNGALQIWGFNKNDPSCVQDPPMTANEVFYEIVNIIYDFDFIQANLCEETPPPCNEPPYGYEYELAVDVCWQKENINGIIYYYPCWDGQVICYELWKLCWDPINGQQRYRIQGPEISGDIYCQTAEINVPDPPVGFQSSCFFLNTNCNPD
jgi:hypothetical protein